MNTFSSKIGTSFPSLEYFGLKFFDTSVSRFQVENLDWVCDLEKLQFLGMSSAVSIDVPYKLLSMCMVFLLK